MDNVRHSSKTFLIISLALFLALAVTSASAQGEFEGWNLEPGVGQAHLVMVARVSRISRLTVVEGAKTDVALREYRFQPVRLLKGIFSRAELSMTAADLGCAADGPLAPSLREGDFRLLILVQQPGLRSMGCVSAAPGAMSFEERVPLFSGPNDPLVGVVETLIRVADSRSRRERAKLLIDRLTDAEGVSAVPLLTSLQLRADWAAADERAYAPLTRLVREEKPAVRAAAVKVLRDMLSTQIMPTDAGKLNSVTEALRAVLESDEASAEIRVAALEAVGNLLALKGDFAWAPDLLTKQLMTAPTYVERAAAAGALSQISQPKVAAELLEALAALPLDEEAERESIYARAAVRADAAGAERVLVTRLERSIAARQSLEAEIVALGRMRNKESLPVLLTAAEVRQLAHTDRRYLAWALGQLRDDRSVPVLTRWLERDDYQIKEVALSALENIDSPAAARDARPLLKSESHLPYKLRLARLLARHGLGDGYALATEHLSDDEYTPAAALVLAALDDPRTSKDLSEILDSRPDRRWHAAALAGLVAIGDPNAVNQVREILADDRHPLAVEAAEAAGLAINAELLVPLAARVQSRNKQVAMASLVALRRYLSGVRLAAQGLAAAETAHTMRNEGDRDESDQPPLPIDLPAEARSTIAEAVATLVADTYVDADVRRQAFAVARLIGGDRYTQLLADLADQAELEGTDLLAEVQAERRRLEDG